MTLEYFVEEENYHLKLIYNWLELIIVFVAEEEEEEEVEEVQTGLSGESGVHLLQLTAEETRLSDPDPPDCLH